MDARYASIIFWTVLVHTDWSFGIEISRVAENVANFAVVAFCSVSTSLTMMWSFAREFGGVNFRIISMEDGQAKGLLEVNHNAPLSLLVTRENAPW